MKDRIEIFTTPHERVDAHIPAPAPQNAEQWANLTRLGEQELRALGLQPWDESGLWLFPAEWYGFIPADLLVTDIFGQEEKFVPGKTDNDTRCGALAYGLICPNAKLKKT